MKEIRAVQISLIRLNDSLQHTEKGITLPESVNSIDMKGLPDSNIRGFIYTYSKQKGKQVYY